jgi:hypothetical protein
MKRIIIAAAFILGLFYVQAIAARAESLKDYDQNQTINQQSNITATLKTSSRLFKVKEDLTSVIIIVPKGSTVKILGSDSTYYRIAYEENEGYILKKHAEIDKEPGNFSQLTKKREASEYGTSIQKQQPVQAQQQQQPQPAKELQVSRFSYLENKYGSAMAARLIAGKIWKGMNSEMVKDSWGTALKINRSINENVVREEWIYKTTWLYFENNTLVDWGPIKN